MMAWNEFWLVVLLFVVVTSRGVFQRLGDWIGRLFEPRNAGCGD